MRRSLATLSFLLVAALLTPPSWAGDPISGKWTGSANSAQGGASLSLTLKLEGETVTGLAVTEQGTEEIKDGAWKDGVLTFRTTYNGVPVALKGSLKDGRIVGTFSYNEGEVLGDWEVGRAAEQ